jgi:hypothetical protein
MRKHKEMAGRREKEKNFKEGKIRSTNATKHMLLRKG